MKVLVYGGGGWIGQQFTKLLKCSNILFIIGKARVDNVKDVSNEIKDNDVTHVVSLIGRTHGTIGNKTYSTIDYL